MFFLATADAARPPARAPTRAATPASSRVLDERTLAFPDYDGNGMFLSLGNMLVNPHVGLLFIDFAAPAPAAAQRDGERRRSTTRCCADLAGGAVRRPRARARGVPELPALHPPPRAGRALALRAARRRETPVPDWKRTDWAQRRAAASARPPRARSRCAGRRASRSPTRPAPLLSWRRSRSSSAVSWQATRS